MKVQVVNKSSNPLPKYAIKGDAGMDLMADFSNGISDKFFEFSAFDEERQTLIIFSGGRALIPTNLFSAIPEGYEIQVRPRSGLSAKSKLRIANSPGTIDSDYLGEIGIIIDNISDIYHYSIKKGERIAQLVLKKVENIEWEEVEEFSEITERSEGGFGSTGK